MCTAALKTCSAQAAPAHVLPVEVLYVVQDVFIIVPHVEVDVGNEDLCMLVSLAVPVINHMCGNHDILSGPKPCKCACQVQVNV